MDIQTVNISFSSLVFVGILCLLIFAINKLKWWGGVKKLFFIVWNIISAIFILLGTIVALIFIVFTAMLFASGKD
ncbi:TPA: hypothetical protein SGQ28_002651 [Staphylococcus aureus]|uniref:hypothetical protein n=1 Tax=Staphylococcus aureus TaxID=1280 RepID=UPI00044B7B11|nr:hypothetical protein [Staphylococcus aureus]EUP78143.1 hypothetical protein T998_02710 [Staphylococcus aureus OCMM6121]EVF57978.1 hypothetical protein T837_02780 [Staphylococcus aureus LPIH6011]MCF8771581.1 hypothetical protein [Staphylococcus aureus]HDB1557950.1 hypothetical protein [Staphylococcus aureus]HEH2200770.1 hypothetical protein [Staphylococcus aureus]